jgi:hypothetical protein
MMTGYGLDDWGSILGGEDICLFSTTSRPALRPTQPPIQQTPGVKRPGHYADHSLSSNAKVKNGRAMPPLLYRSSWRAQFIKDKNNIIFTVLLTL